MIKPYLGHLGKYPWRLAPVSLLECIKTLEWPSQAVDTQVKEGTPSQVGINHPVLPVFA